MTTVDSLDPGDRDPFNLGLAVGDDEALVRARRRLLADRIGTPLVFARQVHGCDVHVVRDVPEPGADEVAPVDALVTTRTDVALGVLAADCVPVLLVGSVRDVPTVVGAAHVGRAGLVAGVVDAVVGVLREVVDQGTALRLHAWVGPAACGACYEVPEELRAEVDARVPGTATTTRWGTPGLDVPAGVVSQLRRNGVVVEAEGTCTIEDGHWFSHRGAGHGRGARAGRPVGRHAAVVRLRPEASGVSSRPGRAAGLA